MEPITYLLASQSPRRRALLGLLDGPLEVIVSGADEESGEFDSPADYVRQIAQRKAEATVAKLGTPDDRRRILIAADTTVALGDTIMAKPADAADARRMLRALRGGPHEVYTGLCVIDTGTGVEWTGYHLTRVTMRPYSDEEIERYIATGDPMDKAGAYAIQHATFRPVRALEGCYLGVMGLSVCQLILALRDLGVQVNGDGTGLAAAHDGFACPLLPEALSILDH
jgi:MAF protein